MKISSISESVQFKVLSIFLGLIGQRIEQIYNINAKT